MRARGVVKVTAGWGHTACVTASGEVLVCGRNFRGQLGLGDPSTFPTNERGHPFQSTFRAIDLGQGLLLPAAPKEWRRKAVAVSCGGEHTAVQLEDGAVLTFGAGGVGQLGHGREANENFPRVVRELRRCHREVLQVACGNNSTIVLAGAFQPASLVDLCCARLASCGFGFGSDQSFGWSPACAPPGAELLPRELLNRIHEMAATA